MPTHQTVPVGSMRMGDCLRQLFNEIRVILERGGRISDLQKEEVDSLVISQIKLSELLELGNCVKYTAVNCFLKFLAKNLQYAVSGLDLTLLLALNLGIKLHKSQEEASKYNLNVMIRICGVQPHGDTLIAMETQFFFCIGFEISICTPYSLLENLKKQHNIPEYFYNAVISYIDFLLSVKSLAEMQPQVVFGGCVIAAYDTVCLKPISLELLVRDLQRQIKESRETATHIMQTLQEILQATEMNSEESLISI